MKFVCLMGRSNSGKSTVEAYLEKMGFTRSISYTTRKPQVRDGVMETNGKEYNFVTEKKFMSLVEKGKIIEYEKYSSGYYGTPIPFGSTRYVAVVCINGFKALKEKYGEQVTGVYLKCDIDKALERAEARDKVNLTRERLELDDELVKEMEECADIIIDSNKELNSVLADILKAIR